MNLSLKSIASWTTLGLILIQFIPLNRINPPEVSDIEAPVTIKSSLKKACYDCHSYTTRWSTPAYIAPLSWVISSTVSSGRNVLNFSLWNNKNNAKIRLQKAEMQKVLSRYPAHQQLYYTWQPEAQLTVTEKKALLQWLKNSMNEEP